MSVSILILIISNRLNGILLDTETTYDTISTCDLVLNHIRRKQLLYFVLRYDREERSCSSPLLSYLIIVFSAVYGYFHF